MPVSLEIVRLIAFRNCGLKGRVGSRWLYLAWRVGERRGDGEGRAVAPVTRKRRAGGGR